MHYKHKLSWLFFFHSMPVVEKCCGSKIPNSEQISFAKETTFKNEKLFSFPFLHSSSSYCYVKVVSRVEKWKRKLRERIWNIKGKLKWEGSLKNRECGSITNTKVCKRGQHEKERDGYSEIEIALNITQKNWVKEPKDRLCLCLFTLCLHLE